MRRLYLINLQHNIPPFLNLSDIDPAHYDPHSHYYPTHSDLHLHLSRPFCCPIFHNVPPFWPGQVAGGLNQLSAVTRPQTGGVGGAKLPAVGYFRAFGRGVAGYGVSAVSTAGVFGVFLGVVNAGTCACERFRGWVSCDEDRRRGEGGEGGGVGDVYIWPACSSFFLASWVLEFVHANALREWASCGGCSGGGRGGYRRVERFLFFLRS